MELIKLRMIALICLILGLLVLPCSLWAALPLTTTDANTTAQGHVKIEQSYDMLSSSSVHDATATIKMGIGPNLEFSMGGGYQWANGGNSTADPKFKFKWRFLTNNGNKNAPTAAMTFGCNTEHHTADKATGKDDDYLINLIYQRPTALGTLAMNAGHKWVGDAGMPNNVNWGISLVRGASKLVKLVGEFTGNYNVASVRDKHRTSKELLAGIIYTGSSSLTYSTGVGYRPGDACLWRLTTGVTYVY